MKQKNVVIFRNFSRTFYSPLLKEVAIFYLTIFKAVKVALKLIYLLVQV